MGKNEISEAAFNAAVKRVQLALLDYFKEEDVRPEIAMTAMQLITAQQSICGKVKKRHYVAACKKAYDHARVQLKDAQVPDDA